MSVSDARNLIEAERIRFVYGDRSVLQDVSLTARAGEFVGLVGPNGSGKTTLLRLLLNLIPALEGVVRIYGQSVRRMKREEIARHATIVPQDTYIDAAFSVRDIVAMGRTPYLGRFRPEGKSDARAIDEAMDITGTAAFADRPIGELSGGERQRVHIARAIAQETPIVLLDEPTSHLDLAHELEILQLVRSLTRTGRCAIAAIHDLGVAARFCDRILMMAAGRIVADGAPAEVLTVENLRRHFNLVARILRDEGGDLIILPVQSTAGETAHLLTWSRAGEAQP